MKPLVLRGAGHGRALVRRLLRRGHPQEPRAALRRRRALRDRPAGADDARRRAAARRRARRRPRPAARSTSGAAATASRADRRRRQRDARDLQPARWSQPIAAGDIVPAVVDGAAEDAGRARRAIRIGATRGRSAARRLRVDPQDRTPRSSSPSATSSRWRSARSTKGRTPQLTLEQTPDRRGRARGHRQPHRPDPRDGRRLRLRAQQVQPRHAGAAPGRIALQAGRSTPPPSTRASPPRRCSSTSRCRTWPARTSRRTGRSTTTGSSKGPVTLRHALEDSRNIPAVKALEAVGPAQVVGYARRLGLTGNYPPYLSLALGAAESTLLEMTSAYSAFANQGVRMTPYAVRSVTDREGTDHRGEPSRAARGAARRHRVPDGAPARRRRAARHRGGRQVARVAARRQDRHDGRVHRRVVRRLRPERHRGRVGGLRREEAARQRRDRRAGGAADLDGLHARLHRHARRPRAARRGSRRPATSSSSRCRTASPRRSSTARSPRGMTPDSAGDAAGHGARASRRRRRPRRAGREAVESTVRSRASPAFTPRRRGPLGRRSSTAATASTCATGRHFERRPWVTTPRAAPRAGCDRGLQAMRRAKRAA